MLRRKEKDATTNGQTHSRKGEFRKVGENLYRYSSNDRYYGVFRVNGKLIWKSLNGIALKARALSESPAAGFKTSVFRLRDPKKALAAACKRLKLPLWYRPSVREGVEGSKARVPFSKNCLCH